MSGTMFAVPVKKTDKVVFAAPLRKYIASTYKMDPGPHEADLAELDALREMVSNTPTVENCSLYLFHLAQISHKFPISEKNIKLNFAWTHAFIKKKPSSFSLHFERAAVLFNIGALYSLTAKAQNLGTPEGLKMAFAAFCSSAGAFAKLHEFATDNLPASPSSDLSAPMAKCLELVMLAQAQECFYLRAVLENKSESILSKLAAQAGDLFDQAYDAANAERTKNKADEQSSSELLVQITAKALYMHSVAQYRSAAMELAAEKYGAEIARLQAAAANLRKANELLKTLDVRPILSAAEARLAKANHENDIVYNDIVPDFGRLPPVGRALVVKANPLPEQSAKPILESLVPLAVLHAASQYNQSKGQLVQHEITRMEEAHAEMQKALVQLGLPASIEALEQPIGLPKSVLEHAAEVRSDGGVRSLQETQESITVMAKAAVELLDQCQAMLDEEAKQFEQNKREFGGKWTVSPSSSLTESLRREINERREMLGVAAKADNTVKNKLKEAWAGLEMISSSQDELERAIPSSRADNTPVFRKDAMNAVKLLLDEYKSLRASNETLAQELRDASMRDDIVPTLVELTGGGKTADLQAVFAEAQRIYEPFIQRITASLQRQQQLLANIRVNNEKFTAAKESSTVISERETALRNLDMAYASYQEVRTHLRDGYKFYTDLDNVLRNLFAKCQDFCIARKTEARELLSELQLRAATVAPPPMPSQAAPMLPRFDPMTGQPLGQPWLGPQGGSSYGGSLYGGGGAAPYGGGAPYGGSSYGGAPSATPYYGSNYLNRK